MLRICCFVILTLLSLGLCGCQRELEPQLQVESPRLPAPPPGAAVAAVYLTLKNPTARDDSLIAASSPDGEVEAHTMVMVDEQMAMRPAGPVPIPAGGQVAFESGGLHLMLREVERPLRVGDQVELHFDFASGAAMTVTVPVVAP